MQNRAMLRSLAFALGLAVSGMAAAQSVGKADGEKISFPGIVCKGQPVVCTRMEGLAYLYAQPGQKAAVLISHGSQGIDSRMFDYVDALQKDGFAALVLDHWTPRGVESTHDDYDAAALLGANELNIAFDSYLAAHWLRGERGFDKVGSIGESQGGAAAILLAQAWMPEMVQRNYRRIYGTEDFTPRPLDAVVGLYGFCGSRHLHRDRFLATPFLFITAGLDDETPSVFCEKYVPYMNGRGGNAEIVVIPGVHHSFDGPWMRRREFGRNFKDCEIEHDETTITLVKTGEQLPNGPGQSAKAFDKCAGKGYTTGHSNNRFVAVPVWTAFFRKNLAAPP